jgi:hypothetical protein
MDHRCGTRITVDAPVVLIYPGHAIGTGTMTELSMSGAFVRTHFVPPELVCIYVAGAPPARDRRRFKATEGYAVRRCHHGIAVEWVEFSPLTLRALLTRPESDARESWHVMNARRSAHV